MPSPVIAAVRVWPKAVASITARRLPSASENSTSTVCDLPPTLTQVLVPQMPAPATAPPIACIASLAPTMRCAFGMLAAWPSASSARMRSSAPTASASGISATTSASVIQSGALAMVRSLG